MRTCEKCGEQFDARKASGSTLCAKCYEEARVQKAKDFEAKEKLRKEEEAKFSAMVAYFRPYALHYKRDIVKAYKDTLSSQGGMNLNDLAFRGPEAYVAKIFDRISSDILVGRLHAYGDIYPYDVASYVAYLKGRWVLVKEDKTEDELTDVQVGAFKKSVWILADEVSRKMREAISKLDFEVF